MTSISNTDALIASDVNLGALEEHLQRPLDSYLSLRDGKLVCVHARPGKKTEEVLATNQIAAKCLASEKTQISRVLLKAFHCPEITPEDVLQGKKHSYITKKDLEIKGRLNWQAECKKWERATQRKESNAPTLSQAQALCKKTNDGVREFRRYLMNPKQHVVRYGNAIDSLLPYQVSHRSKRGVFDALVDRPSSRSSSSPKTSYVEALTLPSLKMDEKKVDTFVTQELVTELSERDTRLRKAIDVVYPAYSKMPTRLPLVTRNVAGQILCGGSDPFERKQVVANLGEGSFGVVHAVQIPGEGTYAEKTFFPRVKKKEDEDFLCRDDSESNDAEVLMELDHPNIIKIMHIESDHEGEHVYMEHVEGSPLFNVGQDSAFTANKMLNIMIQIGEGVAYLHRKGYYHRDIAARNVLVSKDCSTVKIIDFGLARKLNPHSADIQRSGDIQAFLNIRGWCRKVVSKLKNTEFAKMLELIDQKLKPFTEMSVSVLGRSGVMDKIVAELKAI